MTGYTAGNTEGLTLARRVLKGMVEERNVRPLRGADESSAGAPGFIEVKVYRLGTPPSGAEIAAGEKQVRRVCSYLDELGVAHRAHRGSVIVLNERRCWERALSRMSRKSVSQLPVRMQSGVEGRVYHGLADAG